MLMQTDLAAGLGDRPYNNLLRRLSHGDYALIAPHLLLQETRANTLLYNPGDNVEVVYFPCGQSLASYLVPNEDGRDVETILVGREGAVGGIVSEGYLPAYTRIAVKFGGSFVRLPVGRLEAAKTTSRALPASFRVTRIVCLPRSSSRRPATRSIRSNNVPPNGSCRRSNEPTARR